MRLLCPWDFPGKNTGVGCQGYSDTILVSLPLSTLLLETAVPTEAGASPAWQRTELYLPVSVFPCDSPVQLIHSVHGCAL